MRYLGVYIILFLLSIKGFSQNEKPFLLSKNSKLSLDEYHQQLLDSCFKEYHGTNNFEKKINTLVYLLEKNSDQKIDSLYLPFAINFFKDGIKSVSKKEKLFISYDLLLNMRGAYFYSKTNLDSAIYYFSLSATESKQYNDSLNLAKALNGLGASNTRLGNYKASISYFERSIQLRKELRDTLGLLTTANNLSVLYLNSGFPKKSIVLNGSNIPFCTDSNLLFKIYNNIGLAYQQAQYLDSAIHYFKQSLKIKNKIGDESSIGLAYNNIGYLYHLTGDNKQAILYLDKAMMHFNNINHSLGLATVYNSFGKLNQSQKNYKTAIDFYEKSKLILDSLAVKKSSIAVRRNIAECFFSIGDSIKGSKYYEEAIDFAKDLNDKESQSFILNYYGVEALKKNDLTQAERYFRELLELNNKDSIALYVYASLENLSNIYYKQGNNGLALDYANKYLNYTKSSKDIDHIMKAAKINYDLYKKLGNPADALKHYELYIKMRDSIENKAHIRLLADQKIEFEKKQNKSEVEKEKLKRLTTESEKSALTLKYYLTVSLCMLLLLISFLFWRSFHQQKRKKEQIKTDLERNKLRLNSLINELKEHQLAIQNLSAQTKNQDIEELLLSNQKPVEFQEKWNLIVDTFNEIHPQFFNKLSNRINANLTLNEMQLTLLLKMKYSSKEIASILSVSTHAVSKARQRFTKKLQLEEASLADYIMKL